jgi:hypothetical protein
MEPSIEVLNQALSDYIEAENARKQKGTPKPHSYLYASARRKCLRRSVIECSHPELLPQYDANAKARFLRGDQREIDLRMALTRAGQLSNPRFDFTGIQERIEIRDRKGRTIITGYIDGMIRWPIGSPWPTEIKAWSSNITDRIDTFEDICNNPWTWSGAHQLLSYLYANSVPMGVFVLDRSGLPKLIPVMLEENLERMEGFLQDANTVVDHIEAEILPDFIQDISECRRCPFYQSACNPPIKSGEGTQIFTDPDIEQKLLRYLEIEEVGEEYEALDKWVKGSFRGVEIGLAGSVLIQGKWRSLTSYPLPPDVKKDLDYLRAPFKKVDPKGSFSLTVTKT